MQPSTNTVRLSQDQFHAARARAIRSSRRMTPEADLLSELDERMNLVARYQADLDAGDFTDGDTGQLRGGIAYERHLLEVIVSELEARARARLYGYRTGRTPAEPELKSRFAAAKAIDTNDVIRALTGQLGSGAGANRKFSCPFHAGGRERSPSLVVYPDGHFHCYGCGTRGGDAVAFVAEFKGFGQVEALRLLESGVLGVSVLD